LFVVMTENDFEVAAARLFDWLIYLMKLKGAVKLLFLNVVKYQLPIAIFISSFMQTRIKEMKLLFVEDL
jgi:hypothetical protein